MLTGPEGKGQLLQLVLLCNQPGLLSCGDHTCVHSRKRELDNWVCHPGSCHAAGGCYLCGWQLQVCACGANREVPRTVLRTTLGTLCEFVT